VAENAFLRNIGLAMAGFIVLEDRNSLPDDLDFLVDVLFYNKLYSS
jgi:hypothetical protein